MIRPRGHPEEERVPKGHRCAGTPVGPRLARPLVGCTHRLMYIEPQRSSGRLDTHSCALQTERSSDVWGARARGCAVSVTLRALMFVPLVVAPSASTPFVATSPGNWRLSLPFCGDQLQTVGRVGRNDASARPAGGRNGRHHAARTSPHFPNGEDLQALRRSPGGR